MLSLADNRVKQIMSTTLENDDWLNDFDMEALQARLQYEGNRGFYLPTLPG